MSIFSALPSFPPQTPNDMLDNTFAFLLPAGDTISHAEVGSDSDLSFPVVEVDGTSVVVWVTGGTQNTTAVITCTITTTEGRTINRSATIRILPVV